MSERYETSRAISKINRSVDSIKDVMRYSDVEGVCINKWRRRGEDGKDVTHFSTSIRCNTEEDWFSDEDCTD